MTHPARLASSCSLAALFRFPAGSRARWVLALLVAAVLPVTAAPLTPGNLLVLQIGNGFIAPSDNGTPMFVKEITSNGTLVQTISIPSDDNVGIQTVTGFLNHQMKLSADGKSVAIMGYAPPFTGSGPLYSRTDAQAPRAVVTLNLFGVISPPKLVHAFTASPKFLLNSVASGKGLWMAGFQDGLQYFNGSASTRINDDPLNLEDVSIFNHRLFFKHQNALTNHSLIYSYPGLPIATAAPTVLLDDPHHVGNQIDSYSLDTNRQLLYVSELSGLIRRYSLAGATPTFTRQIDTGSGNVTSLNVDYTSTPPVLYYSKFTVVRRLVDRAGATPTVIFQVPAGQNAAFGEVVLIPNTPPAATDLGVLGDTTTTYLTPDRATQVAIPVPGQVTWVKFTIASGADDTTGHFLDIATQPSVPANFGNNDTQIALYRADGTLVAIDDDDAGNLTSQLSFDQASPALPARGPLPASSTPPLAKPAIGQDGPLPAGTYYVAVTAFAGVFNGNSFFVSSNSSLTGTVELQFRTDIPIPPIPPTNIPAPTQTAPQLTVSKKSTEPTRAAKQTFKGTATDPDGGLVANVFVKVGKGKFQPARVSGTAWKFRAKLEIGRNRVQIFAVDPTGMRSRVSRINVVRKSR